jgi:hypothetical protein
MIEIIAAIAAYMAVGSMATGIWKYHDWHFCDMDQKYPDNREQRLECCHCCAKEFQFFLWPLVVAVTMVIYPTVILVAKILSVPHALGKLIGRNTIRRKLKA